MGQIFVSKVIWCFLFLFLLGIACSAQEQEKPDKNEDRPLRIISKPRPDYTDEARKNNIQGTVKLEVTFRSDGKIGDIVCMNDDDEEKEKLIRYGLVTSAIIAAQKIEFDPEIKGGKAITIKQLHSYSFYIY